MGTTCCGWKHCQHHTGARCHSVSKCFNTLYSSDLQQFTSPSQYGLPSVFLKQRFETSTPSFFFPHFYGTPNFRGAGDVGSLRILLRRILQPNDLRQLEDDSQRRLWDHRFTFDRCCFLGEARFGGGPLRNCLWGIVAFCHRSKFRSWDNQNTSDRADWSATKVGQLSPYFSSCLLFRRKWAQLPTRNLKRLIQAVLTKLSISSINLNLRHLGFKLGWNQLDNLLFRIYSCSCTSLDSEATDENKYDNKKPQQHYVMKNFSNYRHQVKSS